MAQEVIDTFVDAFTELLAGIGTGVIDLFNELIYDSELTVVAEWGIVFMAMGLGVSIFMALWKKLAG